MDSGSVGHRLALRLLLINVVGDILNAVVLGDLRTLIGMPIGRALTVYLLSAQVRAQFRPRMAGDGSTVAWWR